jgi:hypothetical protein
MRVQADDALIEGQRFLISICLEQGTALLKEKSDIG